MPGWTPFPTDAQTVELDGSSRPLIVYIAGYRFLFNITNPSDASFVLTEFTPDGKFAVLTEGAEW